MKLAKYLADYLDYERTEHDDDVIDEDIIQQGIEAFVLVENVRIDIINKTTNFYKERYT